MIDREVVKTALQSINEAPTEAALEELRVKYLGRKGIVTAELRTVGQLPTGERAQTGAAANAAREQLESAIKEAIERLQAQTDTDQPIDLTAPAPVDIGHLHPVTQLIDDIVRLFWQMGYSVVDGPEIETEWYNFEALLVKADHPARDLQDTLYLETANLPRTHTSNVQIRHMEANKPPIRIIVPGKVFRSEDEDTTHSWMFHQVEGLVVDRYIKLSDLKGTLLNMLQGLLGKETKLRLRPNYFPYTEPSVEMDASCIICGGMGGDCKTCSGTGWLELGGAGMVHPQVLRNVGIDPEVYSGFAFGFGPERIASIKHGVPDIREFWRPNLKFLEQF